jgi:hypothetical protein
MEFRIENGEEFILISKQSDLEELLIQINDKPIFAYLFKFSDRDYFVSLLGHFKIDYDDFTTKYYHYDAHRKLHVAENEFGYIWISTSGLIARKKATSNRAVNSCLSQHAVISLLIKNAIEIVKDERVYDIQSYKNGLLYDLSPAIFHNLTFYVEVFYKAYLSLAIGSVPHGHKLSTLYQKTVEATTGNGHNDSLLQVMILDPLYRLVEHLGNIPNGFKEQFIKYDDNPMDDTVILFELEGLNEMASVLELSVDFITGYFYEGKETHYLTPDLYQRLLNKAETEEQKERIRRMYSHLAQHK